MPDAASPAIAAALDDILEPEVDEETIEETLVEEVSIDGMCGVY